MINDLHNWINTVLLLGIGVLFFIQKNILDYMKTAMNAINPKKMLEAQEVWEKGQIAKYEMFTNEKVRQAIKETTAMWRESNKDFVEQFNELIGFHFAKICDKDFREREKYLLLFPKTASMLRVLLDEYDAGTFSAEKEVVNKTKNE